MYVTSPYYDNSWASGNMISETWIEFPFVNKNVYIFACSILTYNEDQKNDHLVSWNFYESNAGSFDVLDSKVSSNELNGNNIQKTFAGKNGVYNTFRFALTGSNMRGQYYLQFQQIDIF